MQSGSRREALTDNGLLRIEDCLDATGNVMLPSGATLVSLIDRNAANAGDLVAYRYLDHSRSADGEAAEVRRPVAGRRRAAA
jgi:fatty-acyl-CoA synthase